MPNYSRSSAFYTIASYMAEKGKFNEAIELSLKITDEEYNYGAFKSIIEKMVK